MLNDTQVGLTCSGGCCLTQACSAAKHLNVRYTAAVLHVVKGTHRWLFLSKCTHQGHVLQGSVIQCRELLGFPALVPCVLSHVGGLAEALCAVDFCACLGWHPWLAAAGRAAQGGACYGCDGLP
jgi:hypothetical protein